MDEVLHELSLLNTRFDTFAHKLDTIEHKLDRIDKRLDTIEQQVGTLHTMILANHEDLESLRTIVESNSEAIQRIESKFGMRITQVETNSHEIQRLTEAFNAKFPGYME